MSSSKAILNEIQNFLNDIYKKGFFHLLSGNFMLIVTSFLGYLIIAYFLSPDDIGRIKTLQTYASILVIIGTLGLNVSTLKLCSDSKYADKSNQLFSVALKYVIITSGIVYLISIFLAQNHFFSNDIIVNNLAIVFLISVIPSSVNLVIISYYQAVKEFKSLSKIQVTTKILGILLLVILSYFFGISGYSIGYVLTFLLTFIFLILPYLKKITYLKGYFKEHWELAKYSLVANLLSRINLSIDIIIINFILSEPQQLGQYAFALNFIFMLDVIPKSIQQISIPYFSEKSNNYKSWMKVYKRYNKILLFVILIVTFLSILIVPVFIHYVFEGKYDDSIKYFLILIFGWLFRSLTYLKTGSVIGLGEIKYNFYAALFLLPINIMLIYLFISNYNILGVAYANVIIGILTFFIVFILFKKAVSNNSFSENIM